MLRSQHGVLQQQLIDSPVHTVRSPVALLTQLLKQVMQIIKLINFQLSWADYLINISRLFLQRRRQENSSGGQALAWGADPVPSLPHAPPQDAEVAFWSTAIILIQW